MKKKRIITVGGRPGSGKSTTSKEVAARLGYEHFSSGDLFRAIGKERGIDIHEANLVAEKEKEIDHLVDQKLRDIGTHQDGVAIDSRMAWHWIPNSFKVYLDLDLDVAAARIIQKLDPVRLKHEHIPTDPNEYAVRLKERLESEAGRYKKLYNVDPYDISNYDLVINTEVYNSDEVVDRVLSAYKQWLEI